jgi:hypothetical protein
MNWVDQPVVAQPAGSSKYRWSLRASAGVRQPRLLRGRMLRGVGDGRQAGLAHCGSSPPAS